MDERDLRIFLNLSGFSSIREAGRNLYMTQPSLSSHIKKLEKETGVELLFRYGNGFKLTPAGKRLLSYAPIFISMCEEIRQKTGVQATHDSYLTIGATSSLSIFLLGPVLGHWAIHKSQYNLTVIVGRHDTVINDVVHGRVCMGLVRTLPKNVNGIKSILLGDEKILCVESVVKEVETTNSTLNGKTFFCPSHDNVLWQAVNQFLEENRVMARKVIHVGNAEARLQAIAGTSDTLTFVPESTINFSGNDTSQVRLANITDRNNILKSPVYVIWREDQYPRELSGLIAGLKTKFRNQTLKAS